MIGVVKFADGHVEDILQRIGSDKNELIVTTYGTYMREYGSKFFRYIKDFDCFIPCKDIIEIELEET